MKNPLINASAALAYIVGIVLIVQYGIAALFRGPETFVIPMIMLSLFVLSAAVMGFLFLGMPLQMYLDGQKKEAVELFMQTIGIFAILTLSLVVGTLITIRLV